MAFELSVELTARIDQFRRSLREATTEVNRTESAIDKATNKISSSLTGAFAGVFSIAAVAGFSKAVLDATAEFQKFNAVLGNTLGSAALANLKIKEIQDFAAKTPFGVNELTASFVKLANSGFKPTGDQMRQLGDIAASTGKTFDQLAEAILDAQTGEFERLKEFGIRAKDAGDSVIFTYKGVQTQVEKTSGSIRDYITSLGDAQGVSGSMAKISETLGGQISNLGDSWDQMLLSVGGNTEGVFNSSISVIGKALEKITQYNNELNLASKYDLGSKTKDFFQQLNRAVNPFSSKGATQMELAAFSINDATSEVGKFVSKTVSAAKTTADFGKALADLKKQGDAAVKAPFITSEGQRKGIRESYQLGVKAIQDARNNFVNTVQSDANFGKAGGLGKTVKTIDDILSELNGNLKKVEVQFGATFTDKIEDKIKAYQTAIDGLATMSGGKAVDALKKLQKAQEALAPKGNQLEALPDRGDNVFGLSKDPIDLGVRIDVTPVVTGRNVLEETIDQLRRDREEFTSLGNVLQQSSYGIADGFSAIGQGLASGGNIIETFGSAVLGAFGNFLMQMGQQSIVEGLFHVAKGFAYASNPLTAALAAGEFSSGYGLIGAGALLATGGGLVSGIAGGMGKNKGSSNSGREATAFANGGIISGPTLGLMGEYAGAKNNPEVVAPLSKLSDMIGASKGLSDSISKNVINTFAGNSSSVVSSGTIQKVRGERQETAIFIADSKIIGEDIHTSFRRVDKRLGRV